MAATNPTEPTGQPSVEKKSMVALRLQANELFKRGELREAAALYEAAAALMGHHDAAETDAAVQAEEAVKCYGNLCTVYSRLDDVDGYLRAATAATDIQPAYPKGLAFLGQGELLHAITELTEALAALHGSSAADGQCSSSSGSPSGGLSSSEAAAEKEAERQELLAAADGALQGVSDAYRWVCAASLLAPALAEQLRPSHRRYAEAIAEYDLATRAVASARAIRLTVAPALRGKVDSDDDDDNGHADEPMVSVTSGSVTAGTGVKSLRRLPANASLASLVRPVSVGYYLESMGERLCVACAAVTASADEKYIVCPQCQSVCWCSEECRESYLERHDMHECRHLQHLKDMIKRIEQSDREAPADLAELVCHVATSLSAMRTHHVDAYLLTSLDSHASEVAHTLGAVVPLVCDLFGFEDPRLIQKLCGATRCNAIQLSDGTGLGVGQAIFGGYASRFNHSCSPNAALDLDAREVKTIRPVAKGEELCISYTPQLYLPREMRRRVLSERYYFTCRCATCVGSEATSTSAGRRATTVAIEALVQGTFAGARADAEEYYRPKVLNLSESVRNSEVADVSADLLQECETLLQTLGAHFLGTHYLVQEVRNALVFAASVLGRKDLVAKHAEEEAWLWEVLVPGGFPAKCDKLRNWLLASTEPGDDGERPPAEAATVKGTLLRFYEGRPCADAARSSATEANAQAAADK